MRVSAAAMLALVLCSPAFSRVFSQTRPSDLRSVSGTVTDGGREPLRGAVVQIEAEDTMVIATYVTSETGEYHFRNLRPDAEYSVWATFRGNHSKKEGLSKFDHQRDRVIPLTVELTK
jgi:hypothetical protein